MCAGFGGEGAPPARRARPVADLPLEALLARSGEAARRWAIALIATRPLDAIGEIPLQTLVAGAPALCEQLLAALASDAALESLLSGVMEEEAAPAGDLPARLGELVGSTRPGQLVEALEALRGAIWELLLEELPGAAAGPAAVRLVGDLSDRLAQVCAALLAAALERDEASALRQPRAPEPTGVRAPRGGVAAGGAGHPEDADAAGEPPIVIVDERRAAYASIERPPFSARVAAEGINPAQEQQGFVPLDAQAAAAAAASGRAPQAPPGAEIAAGSEISIRDERGDEGPAAWVGSIGRELQRHERDGEPFAVLLLEARADRAGGAEPAHQPLGDALAAELREGGGSLMRERAGRWWALVPRTDRLGAQALAGRLLQVVEAVSRRSGDAASVAIGIAICPEDGRQAAALAAHADVSLFASRAEGARGAGRPGGSAG